VLVNGDAIDQDEVHHVDGARCRRNSAPRTIVDTYRLRNTAGSDVANEALRRWLHSGGQPAQLIAVARAFPSAMPALLHALEVLL